jgi:hypothetical protein
MTIKKTYTVGDTVWIYGVSRNAHRLTEGKIIYEFTPPNYTEAQYVVSVPSSIEPLLEIRTWNTISQDSTGPVGAMREMISVQEMDAANKKMTQAGYEYDPNFELAEVEPTPEEIHAALERSQLAAVHAPLMIKEDRPKRRFSNTRKKKQ